MNYRDFKAAVALEADEPKDYEQIVFRTPDGTGYNNIKVDFTKLANSKNKVILVDLFNIKPKFKVGDVVCNNSGLYTNVKCTIAEVNEELQQYSYREINGRTYFKDQDKLTLVNNGEVRPPVEDDNKLDILEKSYASDAQYNTFKYNIKHYKLIENISKQIIDISEEGAVSYHFIVPMKEEVDESGIYYEEDEVCGIIRWHFKKLGFDVKDKNDEVNNRTEFFISW